MYSNAYVPVRGKPVVKERAVGDPDLAVHSLYLSFCCIANAGCKHTISRIYYYVGTHGMESTSMVSTIREVYLKEGG